MSSRTPDHISDIEWCFTIRAAAGQRLLMRIVLIFDQQALTPTRLDWRCTDGGVLVSLSVNSEPALAGRIQAKLLALHDVSSVELQQLSGTVIPSSSQGNAHASQRQDDGEAMPLDTI